MSKKSKRNIKGLLLHAAALKSDTEEKVNKAIDALKRSKTKKINFKTVSELSGVSTTTLYNNPVLRERIASLRAVKKAETRELLSSDTARDHACEHRREIKKLKEEKRMLIEQLVEFERLKTETEKLKELLIQKRIE